MPRYRLIFELFLLLVVVYFISSLLFGALLTKRYEILPKHPVDVQGYYRIPKNMNDSSVDQKSYDLVPEKTENSSEAEERELILVQVVFAHGHSSPSHLYPNDPNPKSVWDQGLGQLTEIGALQLFQVGDQLRKLYQNFVSDPNKQIQCLSSSIDRCRKSACVLLASMVRNQEEDPSKVTDLPQTIPINSTTDSKDKYLAFSPKCPAVHVEGEHILLEPESQDFIAKHQRLNEYWSKASGQLIRNYEDAGQLFETLQIEKMNLTISSWARMEWAPLQYQANMWYSFRFKTRVMQRLLAGPLMTLVINRMWEKVSEPQKEKKVYFYSGHRHTIALMLHALGAFNNLMPPFGSYIAFELYRRQYHHEVRILFSNSTSPDIDLPPPRTLSLPGCTEYCQLQFLTESKSYFLTVDWDKECLLGMNIRSKL